MPETLNAPRMLARALNKAQLGAALAASAGLDQSTPCQGEDAERFFSPLPTEQMRAAVLCLSCPVRQVCQDDGMALRSISELADTGVWGALTPAARRRVHAGRNDIAGELAHVRDAYEAAVRHAQRAAERQPQRPAVVPDRRTEALTVAAVADATGISVSRIRSRERTEDVSAARQAVFWGLRELAGWSLPQVGQALDRDHTTVLFGVRRFSQRLHRGELDELADAIRTALAIDAA